MDGSDVDDWTAIKAETIDGLIFTPRFGPDLEPTVWIPAQCVDGKVPRDEVTIALDGIFDRFEVARMYCDPPRWETDVQRWQTRFGEKVVIEWPTYRPRQMYGALERFAVDLAADRIAHDGCPLTNENMVNARKKVRGADRYVLEKPNDHQKIDIAMAAVLAHEAAADARADDWTLTAPTRRVVVYR